MNQPRNSFPPLSAATRLLPTEQLLSLLLEAMHLTPDGIGIFDPDDHLVFTNDALAGLFGLTTDQAQGMTFADLVRQSFQRRRGLHIETDDLDRWIDMALTKRRQQHYRSFQTDTSDGRWVQLTEQLMDSGHMFVFFTDITEQKRAEDQLHQLTCKLKVHAETDELTGVHNRRHFFHLAEQERLRCRRGGHPVSLLLIDVDYFKQVNDQYGHQQGDRVLCHICKRLQRELRAYDVLGRVGGEEFALLLPETDAEQAFEVADRLRQVALEIDYAPQCRDLRTSVSAGVASSADASEALNDLIGQADKALYRAKHLGRNRCEMATTSDGQH